MHRKFWNKISELIFVNSISESGKMAVAYRCCEEVADARTEEELQDLIQVCGEKDSRDSKPG